MLSNGLALDCIFTKLSILIVVSGVTDTIPSFRVSILKVLNGLKYL
jgi:hypothetical protein